MKILKLAVIFLLLFSFPLFSQEYSGCVLNSQTGKAIEFVNIGIAGKNIGTVSSQNGKYKIKLDSKYDNDQLVFSCIGYIPFSIKLAEFRNLNSPTVKLTEKIIQLAEVSVYPKVYEQKRLGIRTESKMIQGGFSENQLGYECGILIKVKKSAVLENLSINIGSCSYDSIFYRLNIYKVLGKMDFENVLSKSIYISIPKENIKETISFDLKSYNLHVQGDFLVTLEHVKDLGAGQLNFCSKLSKKTYFRKTSQGSWETVPIGISISVDAKVEK